METTKKKTTWGEVGVWYGLLAMSALLSGVLMAAAWNASLSRILGLPTMGVAEGFILWAFVGLVSPRSHVDKEDFDFGHALSESVKSAFGRLFLLGLMLLGGLFLNY